MRRDRIADDIHVFISDLYAQVTCGVITTEQGAILIDTLPFPQETREVIDFIRRQCQQEPKYVINTHYHADHVYGTFLFDTAEVIAHRACREALLKRGPQSLAAAKQANPALAEVELRLPDITFEHELYLHVGARTLNL